MALRVRFGASPNMRASNRLTRLCMASLINMHPLVLVPTPPYSCNLVRLQHVDLSHHSGRLPRPLHISLHPLRLS